MFKKQRIVVHTFPNDCVRDFNTTKLVSNSDQSFHRPLNKRSEKYLRRVGKLGARIVRQVIKISGVLKVSTSSYQIYVEISPAHNWDDLYDRILKIIAKEVFNKRPDQIEIEKKYGF